MLRSQPPVTLWAVPFFAGSIALEIFLLGRTRRAGRVKGYEWRDAMASISMGIVSLVVGIGLAAAGLALSLVAWRFRVGDLGTGVTAWVVALVAWDFSYYWNHRAGHRIRLLWANHVQHHSSERYNLSTALRQPVTSVNELAFFPVLCVFGLRPPIVFVAGGINLVYQFWIHTEAVGRLPRPVEFVFNSPSHHRVHHGSNREYLDRNYGGILILWDRLFQTFEAEVAPVRYGLVHDIKTTNLLVIAGHEYLALTRAVKATPGIGGKVLRLVMPPGWEPARAQVVGAPVTR